MAGEPVFLDTNVLVYATVQEAPLHSAALCALNKMAQADTPMWISRQVLREFLCVLSRPQPGWLLPGSQELLKTVHGF